MIRRPISIWIIFFIMLFIPALNIVAAAVTNMVPLWGPGNIFVRMKTVDIAIQSLYVLAAFSILSVRKWGWWFYLFFIFVLLSFNFYVFYRNPFISAYLGVILQMTVILSVIVFFRKEIIAPYFHPRLRWWEQAERYEIVNSATFKDADADGEELSGVMEDISETGCFLTTDRKLDGAQKYLLTINIGTNTIQIQGKVMRSMEKGEGRFGYGFKFVIRDDTDQYGLSDFIKSVDRLYSDQAEQEHERRETRRYRLAMQTRIGDSGGFFSTDIINVSSSGCLLACEKTLEINKKYTFSIDYGKSVDIPVNVAWINERENKTLIGVRFLRKEITDMKLFKKVINFWIYEGRKRENITRTRFKEYCGNLAEQTPLGKLRKLGKAFLPVR